VPRTRVSVAVSRCNGTRTGRGWWAGRVVDQSTERARLIEQLHATAAEVARLAREAGFSAERERLINNAGNTDHGMDERL
jgi:hypothetical protein